MTTKSAQHLWYLALALVLLAALTGCSKREVAPASSAAAPADVLPASAGGSMPAVRARAVSVDTSLTVTDVDARAHALREATESAGGYVADATLSGEHDERMGHMELHVPAAALAPFLAKVSGMGDVTGYNERAEDVTDQRTDLTARLKNARAQEERVQALMTKKTSTLGEVIEAEKELARVRENIERMDAQDRALDGRIAFATVRISLQTKTVEAWRTPGASIARGASNGAHAAANLFLFLAVVFVTVAPTLVPFALTCLAMWGLFRAYGRKRGAALAPAAIGR